MTSIFTLWIFPFSAVSIMLMGVLLFFPSIGTKNWCYWQ